MLQQRLLQPGPSGGASPLRSLQKAACAERYALTAYHPFLMLRALTTVTSPEQRNKISSAHSLHGFSGFTYSRYSARVKPSLDAESLVHLQGSGFQSREKSGLVCRDGTVHQGPSLRTPAVCSDTEGTRQYQGLPQSTHTVFAGAALEEVSKAKKSPASKSSCLGTWYHQGEYSPKAGKRISQVTLSCITSPLHGQTHTCAVPVGLNRRVQRSKRKQKPVSFNPAFDWRGQNMIKFGQNLP